MDYSAGVERLPFSARTNTCDMWRRAGKQFEETCPPREASIEISLASEEGRDLDPEEAGYTGETLLCASDFPTVVSYMEVASMFEVFTESVMRRVVPFNAVTVKKTGEKVQVVWRSIGLYIDMGTTEITFHDLMKRCKLSTKIDFQRTMSAAPEALSYLDGYDLLPYFRSTKQVENHFTVHVDGKPTPLTFTTNVKGHLLALSKVLTFLAAYNRIVTAEINHRDNVFHRIEAELAGDWGDEWANYD